MVQATHRTVILAKEVGFCFGVKRAINLTSQALAERKNVFILGDLVHNKRVTDVLADMGLRKAPDMDSGAGGTMIIRAHGLPRNEVQAAVDKGLEIVDATCPIVFRAQEAAQSLEERGCQVVIIGDRNHAEIKGVLGALQNPALVVDSVEELRELKTQRKVMRKVGVVFQTTHALELCRAIINELVFMCKEVQIINTICRPVQNRQDDALALASSVDLMIVVGSRTSANTVELASLCRSHNPHTIEVEGVEDLRDEDFDWASRVGIASGLSTPDYDVEAVRRRITSFEGAVVPEHRPEVSVDQTSARA